MKADKGGCNSTYVCDSVLSSVCMKYTCTTIVRSASCFADASQIVFEHEAFKYLSQIQIGDRVIVNKNDIYEPVISFIHAKPDVLFDLLEIKIYSTLSNTSSINFIE